jgi:hypothetical protein
LKNRILEAVAELQKTNREFLELATALRKLKAWQLAASANN